MKPPVLVALVLLAVLAPGGAGGQDRSATSGKPSSESDPGSEPRRRWAAFPREVLYPRYLADPDAPATGVEIQLYTTTGIEQAGDRRQHVKLGGAFPLLRRLESKPGGRRWQLRLDGGLDAQFDPSNQTDNTGWDGNYGLMVTSSRADGGLALRFGTFHISAHLGDEWILRTGRERVGYRREELLAGAAWVWGQGRRVYLEGGWAYENLSPLQEPARVQTGFEVEGSAPWLPAAGGWYAALDLSAWEERDWRLDAGVQVGLVARPRGRAWRLGVVYRDGRVPLGEFFAETEAHFGLGLWTEL